MMKKEKTLNERVNIGTTGHKDHDKKDIMDKIHHILYQEDEINDLENKRTIKESVEEALNYIDKDKVNLWIEFASRYQYLFAGLFLKRLVTVLKYLKEGKTIEEITNYLNSLNFNKQLINYICIAAIRFSERGYLLYEKMYIYDINSKKRSMAIKYETEMCRMLTKKVENK